MVVVKLTYEELQKINNQLRKELGVLIRLHF